MALNRLRSTAGKSRKSKKPTAQKETSAPVTDLSSGVVVAHFKKKRLSKKALIKLAVILIVVAVLFVSVLMGALDYFRDKKLKQSIAEGGCSQQTIQEVLPYLGDAYAYELRAHAEKIKNFAEFERDPNCLYIVATYETNSGHISEARKYFSLLERIYDPNEGFSPYFNDPTLSLEQLRKKIETVEGHVKQFEQNSKAFNSPSERR